MTDDPGQVDRRLDARVAAANHRDALALEERTIAMRGHYATPLFLYSCSPGTSMLRHRAPVEMMDRSGF